MSNEKFESIWERAKTFNIHQKKGEFKDFIDFVVQHGKLESFLEIGVNWGGSVSVLLDYFENGFGIDINDCPFFNRLLQINPNYIQIIGNSFDKYIIDTVAPYQFDLLFIDASHDYESVKKDYENYKKYVRKGGLIAFHDITPDNEYIINQTVNVRKLWLEIRGLNKHQEFENDTNIDSLPFLNEIPQSWGGIGVIINE